MKKTTYGGISLDMFLTIIFVILKLCGVITWSWWWVFSPLWITAAIGLVIVLGMIILAILSCFV